MAKEIAIGKRAKITEAQQYMLLAVLGAAAVFGVALALTIHFIKCISFNIKVIAEEEKAIVLYSDTIKNIGVCPSPKGKIYSDKELQDCNPNSIKVSEIPNTLRADILEKIAADQALNSVPKEDGSDCINSNTNKNYTYKELSNIYNEAKTDSELQDASKLIKNCSALRVIPESLPAFKNEEALLASLNKIFNISKWEPESISPSGESSTASTIAGVNDISVNLVVEAGSDVATTVLNNIEKSIREFNVGRAVISWESDNMLSITAQATAFYTDESTISETTKTIRAEEKK